MRKINVLVVEDDEDDLFLLESYLEELEHWDVEVTWAKNYKVGIDKLLSDSFDICFVDHYLGANTGVDFIQDELIQDLHLPFIVLTGLDNLDIDNLAIQSGASDYIPKSNLSVANLNRSIRHSLLQHAQKTELQKQQNRYQNLFEHSLEAVFIADASFNIMEVNETFRNLLISQPTGQLNFRDLFADDADFEAALVELNTKNRFQRSKVKLVNDIGNKMTVNITFWPFSTNAVGPEQYQGVIHDVTELELAQQKLIETEKFQLTGRMARIIGHEVRNPLTNIILASDELVEDLQPLTEDQVELFGMLKRNSTRISKLIDDLLNSTKLLQLNKQNVCIEKLIIGAIGRCKDRIQLKKIELSQIGLERETHITVDEEKFKIALVNLIINATEATVGVESPKLTVKLEKYSNILVINISDNGCGMSKDVQAKIFDPFFTNRSGGLGLGMTNVKNILLQHDALLTVESTEGVGTLFKIKIKR